MAWKGALCTSRPRCSTRLSLAATACGSATKKAMATRASASVPAGRFGARRAADGVPRRRPAVTRASRPRPRAPRTHSGPAHSAARSLRPRRDQLELLRAEPKRLAAEPKRLDERRDPTKNGPSSDAPRASFIARSRTRRLPSRRRTTTANDDGARIMTPSSTACPPMYGRDETRRHGLQGRSAEREARRLNGSRPRSRLGLRTRVS